MKKIWIPIIIAVIIIVVAVIVFYKPALKGTIKIGVLTSLTGSVAEYGYYIKNGIDLATEEINNEGGIMGRKTELFYEDAKCDPKEAVSSFTKLTDIDQVKFVLGTLCSSETLAVAPIANENKIVLISAASTAPQITQAGDYIFRMFPSDAYEGKVAADTIFNQLKKTAVSILYLNNDYGIALRDVFKGGFTKLGGQILNEEGYSQNDKDFRTQLTKIKVKNPEVIYLIGYPIDGGIAIKQARELSIDSMFFGTTGLKANDFISNGGSATEGFILATAADESSQKTAAFTDNYLKKFGIKPGLSAPEAYDSVYVLKEAMLKAKNFNSENVKNSLYGIKDFDGASRKITFDSNGDITFVKYSLFVVKNGQFVPYENP